MTVTVLLPGVLAEHAGGARRLTLEPGPPDVAALLDLLARSYPALAVRVREETGALRRYVNVYVDGVDVRGERGLATGLRPASVVHILPSVAGG